jgi:hypothetical protein
MIKILPRLFQAKNESASQEKARSPIVQISVTLSRYDSS